MFPEDQVINLRNTFNQEGVCICKGIFPPELFSFIEINATLLNSTLDYKTETDSEVVESLDNSLYQFSYGNVIGDSLLLYLTPYYNQISGKNLIPTYSYFRTYSKGQNLIPHKDRPSCQYSVSISIKSSENSIWPLYFYSKKGESVKAEAEIGDIIFYKGEEILHWRNALKFESSSHFFLHWVDKDDPAYKEFWFDGRKKLGIPK